MSGIYDSREKVGESVPKVRISYADCPAPSTSLPTASGAFREPQPAPSAAFRVPQSIGVVLDLKIPPKARQPTVVTTISALQRSTTQHRTSQSPPPRGLSGMFSECGEALSSCRPDARLHPLSSY